MDQLIKVLKNDGVIVFPTDTVWGVGCLASSDKAIKRLYQIKKRELNKPTGIFVRDFAMASRYGTLVQLAEELAQKYWPGPLSLVVTATQKVPASIKGPNHTVSMRVPQQAELLELLSELDEALVQTSANFAGGTPPATAAEIETDFLSFVDGIVQGLAGQQEPSTIIDTTGAHLYTLRQGPIRLKWRVCHYSLIRLSLPKKNF